jgi:hypothetical protein
MIRQVKKISPAFHLSLLFGFSHCPARCGGAELGFPSGHVYRSSKRSITLQCARCGLLWTMTVHQIAKAAAAIGGITRVDNG